MSLTHVNYGDDPADRENEIGQAIDYAHDDIDNIIDALLSGLAARGAFQVHRAWSASVERAEISKAAATAAIRVVLDSGWVNVSDETQALWKLA